jgi:signal transduction histidine kinase
MGVQSNEAVLQRAVANSPVLAALFLVRPFVTVADVVGQGIAPSTVEAVCFLQPLQDSGLIKKKGGIYSCTAESREWLEGFLPAKGETDTLQRAMCRHFCTDVHQSVVARIRQALSPSTGEAPARPLDYFELTAIVDAALTVDSGLNITGCSEGLVRLLQPVHPDLRTYVASGTLGLVDFLRGLELFHCDYETLEPTSVHVLDQTDKYAGLLTHLVDHHTVDKKPALLRMGHVEHYVEMSFALQVAFPGIQSIWYAIDQRVGQLRLIKAMRLTKWFIAAHRLKQPANLFNIGRATLELLAEDNRGGTLTREVVATELSAAIASLSAGIQEFSRFVDEISGDEYRIATRLGESESVDIIAVLDDVIADIDFIYATPSGVEIAVERFTARDLSFFIRANPFLLREALFNIVHNAFKHGARNASNPAIKIHWEFSPAAINIEVADNGPGMNSSDLEAYARAFRNIRATASPAEVGALSGLSLAMAVIKGINGSMSFENLSPKGFRVGLSFAVS